MLEVDFLISHLIIHALSLTHIHLEIKCFVYVRLSRLVYLIIIDYRPICGNVLTKDVHATQSYTVFDMCCLL